MNTRAITAFGAAVTALALLVAGCGVGSTDDGEVAATTGTYLSALVDADYELACEQLAPAARPEGDCATAVERSVQEISRDAIREDADGKTTVEVSGDEATVTLESGRTLELAKTGGTWLVESGYEG